MSDCRVYAPARIKSDFIKASTRKESDGQTRNIYPFHPDRILHAHIRGTLSASTSVDTIARIALHEHIGMDAAPSRPASMGGGFGLSLPVASRATGPDPLFGPFNSLVQGRTIPSSVALSRTVSAPRARRATVSPPATAQRSLGSMKAPLSPLLLDTLAGPWHSSSREGLGWRHTFPGGDLAADRGGRLAAGAQCSGGPVLDWVLSAGRLSQRPALLVGVRRRAGLRRLKAIHLQAALTAVPCAERGASAQVAAARARSRAPARDTVARWPFGLFDASDLSAPSRSSRVVAIVG
jgi:hypothetical protein